MAGAATSSSSAPSRSARRTGTPFATQPVVYVEDAAGDVVTTSSLSVTLAITAGTGTSGASLSCTANPLAAAAGVVSFAGCTVSLAGSGYTLTATGSGVTAGVSASLPVS